MEAFLVFLLCLLVGSLEASDCPPKEDVWPCTCTPSGLNTQLNNVLCSSIRQPEELVPPMQALRRSKTKVDFLTIANSTLSYIPDNLLQDTQFRRVRFVRTRVTNLSENGTAFIGLENVLEWIWTWDVDFETGLHLDQLRNLQKLDTIILNRCIMHSAISTFPHLPKLTRLMIGDSGISSIADRAFSELTNLQYFQMPDNNITELRRNMFPNPAERIYFIDLSGNRLSSLPKDFFVNMPMLGIVDLSDNRFVTMEEKAFAHLLSRVIWMFSMHGNPLHCDCKLSWLGNVTWIRGDLFPGFFRAKCATPEAFSGKEVGSLDFESLALQKCHSGLLESLPASERLLT